MSEKPSPQALYYNDHPNGLIVTNCYDLSNTDTSVRRVVGPWFSADVCQRRCSLIGSGSCPKWNYEYHSTESNKVFHSSRQRLYGRGYAISQQNTVVPDTENKYLKVLVPQNQCQYSIRKIRNPRFKCNNSVPSSAYISALSYDAIYMRRKPKKSPIITDYKRYRR